MTDVLSVEGKPIDIAKDMWVRLKIGIYKGSLAKVVNVSDLRRKVMVKLIPRVDLQAIADKLEGRKVLKKANIPSPRLMKMEEARNLNIQVDYKTGRSTNIQFSVIDGKMFKEGFLYKTVSMKSIDYQNIQPTYNELEKFCESGHGVVGSMSTSTGNRKKSHFMKGDAVIVVKGDLKNLMGWVEKVEEDNVHIRPKVKNLFTTVAVNERYVCKSFKPGDHVKVVVGAHKGVSGMVIKVNSNVLIISSDINKEDVTEGRQKGGQRGYDSFVGSTIKIRVGHYKGCRGRVVSVKGQSVGVELESQMETCILQLTVEISTIPDVSTSFSEPPQHGIGSETPIHHPQTPTHSYTTPTRNEGETPGHSGTRTHLRDQAWNPNAATTSTGAKWEDGNPGSWGTIPPTQ
ncbi:hypothetical protein MKX01_010731, partial [Papaver californicum]